MRPNLITRLKEEWNNLDPVDPLRGLIADAIDALAEQPAQQQEPVAWLHPANATCVTTDPTAYARGIPLYTSPQAQPAQQEPVTVLPDGSAFAVMSYPLPKDHWLYADRQYNDGEYEPVELGKPVLTHELRDAVVSAVRYAIRGATNCGKEVDFDPDALVQNAVYALCGPFTSPPAQRTWVGLTKQEFNECVDGLEDLEDCWTAIEAKLMEKNHG